MSGNNASVNSVKGTSSLVRPRFEPGMLLQHEDLEQMSTYSRDLNRLMFRSLFGCGVVCGLVVRTDQNCGKDTIVVGAGLALDGCGDPIQVPKDQPLTIDEHCDPNLTGPLWVLLCRSSRCCAPRTAICSPDDEDPSSVCTREREGYEIRIVRKLPACACACPPKDIVIPVPQAQGEAQANAMLVNGAGGTDDHCLCVDPTLPCYQDHYAGICACCCDDCTGGACNCDCVVLARLDPGLEDGMPWVADHSVRRFVRPVLMRDPQVAIEQAAQTQQQLVFQQSKQEQAQQQLAQKELAQYLKDQKTKEKLEQVKAAKAQKNKP
jgi:hypothetical protein